MKNYCKTIFLEKCAIFRSNQQFTDEHWSLWTVYVVLFNFVGFDACSEKIVLKIQKNIFFEKLILLKKKFKKSLW